MLGDALADRSAFGPAQQAIGSQSLKASRQQQADRR
jgi:hypothetical protein